MKRYILLLALVSMQAHSTLPNETWERFKFNLKSSFQSKMSAIFGCFTRTAHAQRGGPEPIAATADSKWERRVESEEKAIRESFGEHLDNYLISDDLNEKQRKQAWLVKDICSGHLLEFLEKFPESNTKERLLIEGGECIANVAQKQGEYKYKHSVDHSQLKGLLSEYGQIYKRNKQEFGKRVRDEVLDKYHACDSLSFLFKDPFGEKVIAKAIAKNNSYLSILMWDPKKGIFQRMPKSEKQCRAEMTSREDGYL